MRIVLLAALLALRATSPAGAADPRHPPAPDIETPPALDLAQLPDDATVAQLLWSRSPDLVEARARMETARGELLRAGLRPDPSVDATWGTIPIGPKNPAGLSSPMKNVPNYGIGLSTLVEIAKRGPRKRAANGAYEAAVLDAYELLRQRWYDLREREGEVATGRVRVEALTDLMAGAHDLTQLQRQRSARGDVAGLDADRAALDESKYDANLQDERQKMAEAVLACGRVAGVPCVPFDDAAEAAAFLASGLVPPDAGDLDARPDLRALAADDSAEAAMQLARNRRIPDPTVRLGYLRDQFTISGNQLNSLYAGVSVPLPVFDRGQADAMEAAATGEAAGRAHDLLRAQAERDIGALVAQAREATNRREALDSSSLPLAHQLVDTLQSAVQRGGASLGELLLARRTLGELLLAAADVRFLSFRLASEIGRTGALGPPTPVDLAPAAQRPEGVTP